MTEQMAIEYGKDYLKDLICACCKVEDTHKEFVRFSIEALEKQSMVNEILNELQQYRAIGTVEEIQTAMKYMRIAKMHGTVGKAIDACAEYESIGTVEELQALKEKSEKGLLLPAPLDGVEQFTLDGETWWVRKEFI